MNAKQQELINQLENALGNISGNTKTEAEVELLLHDFVASLEEIAADLKENSDEEIAATLKAIVHVAHSGVVTTNGQLPTVLTSLNTSLN